MRRFTFALGSLALVLALGACSQAPLFSMDGSYFMTFVVTESNVTAPGQVEGFVTTVTTTGDQVDATINGTIVVTGTRVGNTVVLQGPGAGTDVWEFDLTWMTETNFEASGRFEDGADYVEFEGSGFASTSIIVP